MICQFISQKCHNFLRWSRSRVFWPPYKTRDFLLLSLRTCVRAEHSTYLTALSSRASFSPLSQVRARCLFLASFSRVLLSSLRSTWVPTSRKGVRGQWCVISGTHCEEAKPREEWGGEEQTPDQLKVTVQSTSVEYKRVSLIHSVRVHLTVDYTSVKLKWILPNQNHNLGYRVSSIKKFPSWCLFQVRLRKLQY